MNTTLEFSSCDSRVTPYEIACTEKILVSIDHNNSALGATSQWFLIWEMVRDLSLRLETLTYDNFEPMAARFRSLVEKSCDVGNRIRETLVQLQISPEHLGEATGFSFESFDACIGILNDFKELHFGTPPDKARMDAAWMALT